MGGGLRVLGGGSGEPVLVLLHGLGASAAEWVGCAIVPALIGVMIAAGSGGIRIAAACFAVVCAIQVALTEKWLGAPGRPCVRLARVLAFPLACTLHGTGGIAGAVQLIAGGSGIGKTERNQPR